MAGAETDRDQSWLELMIGLRVMWDRLCAPDRAKATAAAEFVDPDPKLTALIAVADNPQSVGYGLYSIANEAELRLAGHMDRPNAIASFGLYKARAEAIGATGLDSIATAFSKGQDDSDVSGLSAMRAALTQLMQTTHTRYSDRWRNRQARNAASERLTWVALIGVIVPILLIFLFYASAKKPPETEACMPHCSDFFIEMAAKYHFTVLIYCGILGAIFSRLIAFQSLTGEMTYTDMQRNYQLRIILLRLFVGGIAAFVVYYLILGGILGGDLFPPLPLGNLGDLFHSVVNSSGAKEGYTMPSEAFAKMVVWCFLAGFSERFIPDKLVQVEAQATVKPNG